MTQPTLLPLRAASAYNPNDFTTYIPSGHPNPVRSDNAAVYDKIPVLNQGSTGSCTIFAVNNWDYIMREIMGLPYEEFSEAAEYYEELLMLGTPGVDTGGYTWSAVEVLEQFGAMPEADDVYTATSWKNPPPADWIAALRVTAKQAQMIMADGPSLARWHVDTRDALSRGFPILTGIQCYQGIFLPPASGAIPMPSGSPIGGHEIVLIDYDCEMTDPINPGIKGYYKFRNSWGPGWGSAGNGWIPFDYFAGNLTQGYVVAGVTAPKTPPTPKPAPIKIWDDYLVHLPVDEVATLQATAKAKGWTIQREVRP